MNKQNFIAPKAMNSGEMLKNSAGPGVGVSPMLMAHLPHITADDLDPDDNQNGLRRRSSQIIDTD